MLKKVLNPCGLHCIKMQDIGVKVGDQTILEHIDLHVHCSTLAAVIGKNGAGKSTLVKAILGDRPHTGTIEFKDREDGLIQNLRIGYVPQSLNIEKKTPISVYDMIACYQSRYPVFWKKSKKVYEKIRQHLAVFQAEELIDKQVCNLSGGELQRVLLSMAIMDEPHLLLLDEPVSGIDQNGMDLFYQIISELKQNYDLAIILISHDLDYVARYADQVILLDNKTVACHGTVRQVFESEEFHRVFGDYTVDHKGSERQTGETSEGKMASEKNPAVILKKRPLDLDDMDTSDIFRNRPAKGGRKEERV